jgi:hypothetical protein
VGNSAQDSVLILVDPLPPNLFLDQPLNYTTNRRDFNISGRLSEPGSVTVGSQVASVPEDDLHFSIPMLLSNDSDIFTIVVADIAGNSIPWTMVVRLDEEPPELTLTSPADGAFVTTPDLLLRGTMEPTATIYLNGVRVAIGGSSTFAIPSVLTEGENALVLQAVDLAGNQATVRFTVTLDTGLPPLDIIAPNATDPLAMGSFDMVLRTEVGATVRVENTTVVATEPIVSIPVVLPDGRHSLAVEAVDLAGNTVRRVVAVVVDTRVPLLSVEGGESQRTKNETFRLLIQTEPGAILRVGQLVGQADDRGVYGLNVRLHPGANPLTLVARDAAGNQATLAVTITLEQPDPAAPAGFAMPTGGALALLAVGAVLLAIAAPVARRVARLLP